MAVKPLGDRVLLEVLEAAAKTKGGIVLPDTAKEKQQEGKGSAVGKGKAEKDGKVQPLEAKPGERVRFSKYGGTEVTNKEGKENLIGLETDTVAGIT